MGIGDALNKLGDLPSKKDRELMNSTFERMEMFEFAMPLHGVLRSLPGVVVKVGTPDHLREVYDLNQRLIGTIDPTKEEGEEITYAPRGK